MPAIGAPLRKWTLFLLLCSIPTYAQAQAANETATTDAGATASSSTTTHTSVAAASSPTPSLARRYTDTETVCPYRTINYITHTLPQQCAKATWSAPSEVESAKAPAAEAGVTATPHSQTLEEGEIEHKGDGKGNDAAPKVSQPVQESRPAEGFASVTVSVESEAELETDSPFDNANFLSFEEWKKKNLEQVGQSPENVGQGRGAPSNQPARRRPVNVNALDSLGDEGEIEIDFSGFRASSEGENIGSKARPGRHDAGSSNGGSEVGKTTPSSWALSKDAGKTCKERFNYASFDCAATVLKANKQAKSLTSILVENKDSYMLNECSANNKFLIVELCDDIYVDTIVLANYEFFSSMFRHFRVSVSDRYPVKMERWRTLGTFEARNVRDIQPFLITEPQIWARYLRVEFLTQFGNEFYCPLSLLRVHGTTMMEQFRREEEEARGIDDDDADLEDEVKDVVKPAEDSGPLPPDQIPIQPLNGDGAGSKETVVPEDATQAERFDPKQDGQQTRTDPLSATQDRMASPPSKSTGTAQSVSSRNTSLSSPSSTTGNSPQSKENIQRSPTTKPSEASSPVSKAEHLAPTPSSASDATFVTSSPPASRHDKAHSAINATSSTQPSSPSGKASSNSTVAGAQAHSQPRGSSTQPNAAVPSTQESFFKSIHKRLLYLEANSTLSLQYIEEQSRSLRDAFLKVEKRQLAKTEKFLDHLNSTVMLELKSFRNMYDQLWQSTVIELESMKERQKSEMGEISTRLSLLADELVWQKRMAVVQSTLLLLCLGLVLFVRSGTLGSSTDVPIVQQLGSKYTNFFETPPRGAISGIERRRRTFKNMWRSDTSAGLSDHQSDAQQALSDIETDDARSPVHLEYSPPTPDTPAALAAHDGHALEQANGIDSDPMHDQDTDQEVSDPDDQAARVQVLETQSGPATPNGSRDSRPSWEEVDRAMDQLKAEEQGLPTPKQTKRDRERKKKRSPLRRAHSSFDGTADDSPSQENGDHLFVM